MDIPSLYAIYRQHPVVSIDTRKIKTGCLFFALKGENFDGNRFAADAIQQGAAYAVVSDPSLQGGSFLFAEDPLSALQMLAQHHRHYYLKIPVIAITGSNGKTTTKELITAVLSKKYRVHATPGNLNNHIGVPLTLLGASPETEIIICEMGANHPDEISFLCEMAEPTYGIITNIGQAHLEGFGSVEGVQKAKGELFDYLKSHHGFVFVNADDTRIKAIAENLEHKITYGLDETADPQVHFHYSVHKGTPGFTLQHSNADVVIRSGMFGHYNASNIVAAYTIGNYFKVDEKSMVDALSGFIPGANRSELISFKETIVVKDAYNANPSSMKLALQSFAEQFPKGWVILGDMKELGNYSKDSHAQMLALVSTMEFERIYLVGDAFIQALYDSAIQDKRILANKTIDELRLQWNWDDCKGKGILLKGSRSMRLEDLLLT